ncbi:phospho-N-acetylmuramoyl-pentapeptide-transferase [Oribacterium parvum]|uniref:phospho-N-acetylmuramoyl-pentapeptide- transferase n=1 Tax=Oribacterium parvum TaxID=1501329 RepID=UPI0028EFDB0A|nr:phospho-N-acetylmuramoyl-pentapeptide-transferase [Oribacterium parvum]
MLSNTIALSIAFCVMLLISPKGINILHRMKFGQEVRDEGPQTHLKKQGTPTMGGILFLIAISIGILPFIGEVSGLLPAYLLGLGFGIVGFVDDYLKVVKHQSEGFNPKQKMVSQIVISLLYIAFLYFYSGRANDFLLPFVKETSWSLGILFFPVSLFIITATDTGANFTDGIDGLCSSVTAVIVFFLFLVDRIILGGAELGALPGAVLGGLLGFLCFNAHPAKVFMGDTGSLALGGFVVAMAIQTGTALYIPLFAFVYFMEVLSVIMQVTYFKMTHGKRIFKMAPIHHHFELLGWSETQVVTIFTIITILACFITGLALEMT